MGMPAGFQVLITCGKGFDCRIFSLRVVYAGKLMARDLSLAEAYELGIPLHSLGDES